MTKTFIDMTGQVISNLTVLSRSSERRNSKGERLWHCQCACGGETFVTGSHLRQGDVTSCGCLSSRKTAGMRRRDRLLARPLATYIQTRSRAVSSGCVEWTGARSQAGYGVATLGNRYKLAHRLAYEAFKGAIPDGLFVCHTCDNPSCVNPEHLWLGTHQDNMSDKVRKGRHSHGETSGLAKLTEAQVQEILHAPDVRSSDFAQRFGVTRDHIAALRTGRSWKHLQLDSSSV